MVRLTADGAHLHALGVFALRRGRDVFDGGLDLGLGVDGEATEFLRNLVSGLLRPKRVVVRGVRHRGSVLLGGSDLAGDRLVDRAARYHDLVRRDEVEVVAVDAAEDHGHVIQDRHVDLEHVGLYDHLEFLLAVG